MDTMLAGNDCTNKRSSTKDFLRKMNSTNANCVGRIPVNAPSTSNSMANKIHLESKSPSSSQPFTSSLSSVLNLNQSVPLSLRQLPCTMLDEIRHLHQQKQQFEELKRKQLLESNILAIRSHNLPRQQHQEESILLESFKEQNTILWECMKRCEGTIKDLEESQSKFAQANARLKSELRDQVEINRNLVQRNTEIVLDASAKDQQIAVLTEQRKCLTKQNSKLKCFLRKADSYLDSLQSQQYILQQRQEHLQQNVTAFEGTGVLNSSASKKRRREDQASHERDGGRNVKGGPTKLADEEDAATNDRNVITIDSTNNEKDAVVSQETNVVSDGPAPGVSTNL